MSKDTIYREDAIAVCDVLPKLYGEAIKLFIKRLPSADRPQGDVDAVAIFEREMHNLEQGYITIGEFDERIEPLRHLCYDRPQGKWIAVSAFDAFGGDESTWLAHGNPTAFHYCSECREQTRTDEFGEEILSNYCPNCGAKMKGEGDE